MLPRFGHSLLTDRRGSLWLFGGYSLSHGALNDIRLFDTKNNTWMQVGLLFDFLIYSLLEGGCPNLKKKP
jgi:hypothetical protein